MTASITPARSRSHRAHAAGPRTAAALERLSAAVVARCSCCISDAVASALDAGATRDQVLDAMGGAMLTSACEGDCKHACKEDA